MEHSIDSRRALFATSASSTNALFCAPPSTTSSTSETIKVPVVCRQQNSTLRFESSYVVALNPRLSRQEYYQIVHELNIICVEHAPLLTCKGCCVWLIPFFGCYLMFQFNSQLERFNQQLDKCCSDLNARYAHRGITFHKRSILKVTVAEAQTLVVDIELAPVTL